MTRKQIYIFICSIILLLPVSIKAQYYNTTEKYLKANKNVGVYGGSYFFEINNDEQVRFWPNPLGINNIVTETNYVVSDPNNGGLLFYTVTYKDIQSPVFNSFTTLFLNKDHQPIANGQFSYIRSITEMMHIAAITPTFDNEYLFYVFYYENLDDLGVLFDLKYGILDMAAHNGQGEFIEKGHVLKSGMEKQMQRGVIPGNDCNIWVLFLSEEDDELCTYQIKRNTLDTVPVRSPLALRMELAEADNPIFKIAPDRQTIFMTSTMTDINSVDGVFYQELNLLRFDIDNGKIFNHLKVPTTKLKSDKNPFCNYEFIDHNTILLSLNVFTDTVGKMFTIDISDYSVRAIESSITEHPRVNPTRRFVEMKKYKDYYYLLHPKFLRMDPNTMQIVTFDGAIGGIKLKDIYDDKSMTTLNFNEGNELRGFVNDPVYLNNNFFSMETIYPLPYQSNFTNKVTESSYCFINNLQVELSALKESEVYTWDDGSTQKTRTITQPGTYWVRYPNKCIFLTDSFYIKDVFEYLDVKDLDTHICKQQFPLRVQYPDVVDSVMFQNKRVPDNRFYATEDAQYAIELYKNGCVTPAKVSITSESCPCDLFAPNAFTPNGDGLNDYFKPITLNGCVPINYEFQIFNRYGNRVFFAHQPYHEGWDGTLNGKPLPAETYIFEMRFKDAYTGKDLYYKGDVTLIR